MALKTTQAIPLLLATSLAVWAGLLGSSDRDIPDPQFLASDLFFQMDTFAFSIPAVALQDVRPANEDANALPEYRSDPRFFGEPRWFATNEYKTALLAFAGNQEAPAHIKSIEISLEVYGTYGEYAISGKICPLLSREWSQQACLGELRQAQPDLPMVFRLAVASTKPATLDCDGSGTLCYGTVLVTENLYATWLSTCRNEDMNNCLQKYRAEEQAISDFIHFQLRDGRYGR